MAETTGPPRGLSWERWPDGSSGRAHQVLRPVSAAHPDAAVDLLDQLLGDLHVWRRILAEITNRRFEPSTDDRHQ
jgi:hypothetical protein